MRRYLDQKLKLHLLRVIDALDAHGSLLKASTALGVSQPALTRSLKDLEELVGTRLFERHSRGVRPTEAGVVLLRSGRRILAELRRTEEDLDLFSDSFGGVAAIGALPTAAAGLAPAVLLKLKIETPAFRVRLEEGRTEDLLPLLAAGQLDLIIGRFYEVSPSDIFLRQELWSDPMAIVARADHPLFDSEHLDLAKLGAFELVLPVAPVRVAAEIEAILDTLGLESSSAMLSTSYNFTREILLSSNAFTIVPPMVLLGDLNRGTLAMRAIPFEYPLRPAGVITVRDRNLNGAATAFIACLKDNIKSIVASGLATIGAELSP